MRLIVGSAAGSRHGLRLIPSVTAGVSRLRAQPGRFIRRSTPVDQDAVHNEKIFGDPGGESDGEPRIAARAISEYAAELSVTRGDSARSALLAAALLLYIAGSAAYGGAAASAESVDPATADCWRLMTDYRRSMSVPDILYLEPLALRLAQAGLPVRICQDALYFNTDRERDWIVNALQEIPLSELNTDRIYLPPDKGALETAVNRLRRKGVQVTVEYCSSGAARLVWPSSDVDIASRVLRKRLATARALPKAELIPFCAGESAGTSASAPRVSRHWP
jgi:hypothetical protein